MDLYSHFLGKTQDKPLVLVTILKTCGSTPQVTGACAIFSKNGIESGTIGGGIMEAEVAQKANNSIESGISSIFEFSLDSSVEDENGAICGGSATILIDADPARFVSTFSQMQQDGNQNIAGLLITVVDIPEDGKINVERDWLRSGEALSIHWEEDLRNELLDKALQTKMPLLIRKERAKGNRLYYIEPVLPLTKLVIVGAGHVGNALCHLAHLLDFQVTVIDDRPDFANKEKLPDASRILCGNILGSLESVPMDRNTYIVIVTHGHQMDAETLRFCLGRNVAYIGMIGSRRKIRLTKDKFIRNGWATRDELDGIHAPVGLDIKAETVQEIAVSIAAELVQVSRKGSPKSRKRSVSIIILAAGESKRMGEPKMLMDFEGSTVIETVVQNAVSSKADHVMVVTGAHGEAVRKQLSRF
jgi:xanthine dehydrogenase accessory factor